MNLIIFLAWISAYTLVLANLALFAAYRILTKDKAIGAFLFILLNMAFVTVSVMALAIRKGPWDVLANLILINVLSLYNLSVPLFLNSLKSKSRIWTKRIIVIAVSWSVILNALTLAQLAILAQMIFWIPTFSVSFILVRHEKHRSLTALERTGLLSGLIVLCLSAFDGIALVLGAGRWSWFQVSFFAVFTILYQLPSLVFVGNRLKKLNLRLTWQREADQKVLLTPRETEVAQALMNGLTYKEIGDKLFISLAGVKKHVNNIYQKSGVRNSRELFLRFQGEKKEDFATK